MKSKYAYLRISMKDQHPDRQIIALKPYHIPKDHIYLDTQSGKDFNRPEYKKLLKKLRSGDILFIKSIDRLGRNYDEIIEQWRILTKDRNIDIRVLDMPLLDTTYCKDLLGSFISDLVLQVLSFAAQLERENLLQRQAEGIAAAKAKGVVFGRTAAPLPNDFDELYKSWRDGCLTREETAALCGFSVRTLYSKTEGRRGK